MPAAPQIERRPWFGLGGDRELLLQQVSRFAEGEMHPLRQRIEVDDLPHGKGRTDVHKRSAAVVLRTATNEIRRLIIAGELLSG
jgi:hypothetical protein